MASIRLWQCVVVASLAACGGSSGGNKADAGGGGGGGGDAGSGGSGSDQVAEGTLCTGTGSGDQDLCGGGDSDFQCVSLTESPHFFCTLGCGTGPCAGSATSGSDANCLGSGTGSDGPPPPAGGDAICEAAEQAPGGTGTPRCTLFAADPEGSGADSVDWACAILCGTDMGGNSLGTCPTGLTCTGNICR
nr:hypothetical protein [Kofleriaceae bacterium]